jgi:phosphatidylserine/phosphatidylglycerophosphate/cardiolipin synthase-like enzyme
MSGKTEVCATGPDFLTGRIRYIFTVICERLEAAESEIFITAYSIGKLDDKITSIIKQKLELGVKVIFIIERLKKKSGGSLDLLMKWCRRFENFDIYDFNPSNEYSSLHAKIIAIDRKVAIIGSSNLSKSGHLYNYEMGVVVRDGVAAQVVDACYSLLNSRNVKKVE